MTGVRRASDGSSEAARRLRRIQADVEADRGGQRIDMSDVTTRLRRIVRRNPRVTQAALVAFRQLQRYDAWSQRSGDRWRRWRRRFPADLAAPAVSPLASEYAAIIENSDVIDPESGRNIAFCVSSRDSESGRGDLYVAAGLARELRRAGWRTAMYGTSSWDLVPDGTDIVVAMVPAVDPQRLPPGAIRIAWARSFLDQWLTGDQVGDWDAWLAVSDVMAGQLRERVRVPVGVLPIAVDPELFSAGPPGPQRSAIVSTANDFGGGRQLLAFLDQAGVPKSLVLYGVRRRRTKGIRSRQLRRHEAGPVSYFAIPAVYQSAAIVLDDQLPGARAVGSLNSRIYEALAAGALPITNSRLALEGVGLQGVPVYHDAASLREAIERHRDFGPETRDLVDALRTIVLERHTFATRAQAFQDFVTTLPESRRPAITLGFFPDYREDNHYQSMLYEGARAFGVSVMPLQNPMIDPPSDMPGAVRIWNLQWTVPIFAGVDGPEEARLRVANVADRIRVFRREGGIVVWTVHNREPHENRFPDAERELQQTLADESDFVHVMCLATAHELPALNRVEPDRMLLLAHSSYVGWYPDAISQVAARRRLGLPLDAPIVGLVGGVRPYKGIDRLVAALDRPEIHAMGLEAIVAGKPAAHPETAALRKLVRDHPRVHPYLAFIPHDELQVFMKAADAIVLPYRKTLNSGALFAALTFGRPVIAPREGCLAEVLDDSFSLAFGIDDDDSLAAALARINELRTPEARLAARRAAEANLSSEMSRQFFQAVLGAAPR